MQHQNHSPSFHHLTFISFQTLAFAARARLYLPFILRSSHFWHSRLLIGPNLQLPALESPISECLHDSESVEEARRLNLMKSCPYVAHLKDFVGQVRRLFLYLVIECSCYLACLLD